MIKNMSNEIDPRECMYRLGPSIRKVIAKALKQKNVDDDAKNRVENAIEKENENKQLIDYETLSDIHKYLQRIDKNYNLFFYQLLDECRVITPQKRSNDILDSRLRKLKCEQTNKEYNVMTKGLSKGSAKATDDFSFGSEFRKMRPLIIAVINGFFAVIGTFFFCYKAVEYALPKPMIPAVMFGLIGASIVAIAELYFLIRII